MTVREYIESEIKKEGKSMSWVEVKKEYQKKNPSGKSGSYSQNMKLYKDWKSGWRPWTSAVTPAGGSGSGTDVTDDKIKQKEILEKSGVIDCLKALKKFTVDPTPKKNPRTGNWYLELKNASQPNYTFRFLSDGTLQKIDNTSGLPIDKKNLDDEGWDCPSWKKYRIDNGIIQDVPTPTPTLPIPTPAASKETTPTPTPTPSVNFDITDKDTRRAVEKQSKEDLKKQKIGKFECIGHIKKFHNSYKTGSKLTDHDKERLIVKACYNQHNGKFNDRIQNMLYDLTAINAKWEPEKTKYRILDSVNKVEKIIKESLKKKLTKINESKVNNLIKEDLLKTRLLVHETSVNNFKKLSTQNKIKSSFKFLREIHKIEKLGLLSENLTGVFQELFGNSLENIVDNISTPLFKSILSKLDLPEDIRTELLDEVLMEKSMLISHMESCEMMSKFISDKLSQVVTRKLELRNILNSELIDNTILELMMSEDFSQLIGRKIESEVCTIFDTYVENAKNLVTKIKSDLTSPE